MAAFIGNLLTARHAVLSSSLVMSLASLLFSFGIDRSLIYVWILVSLPGAARPVELRTIKLVDF